MELVSKYSFRQIITKIIGKNVQFTSDCEFFPNFNVIGKVLNYKLRGNEIIFKLKVKNSGKIIDVGSNMKNLQFKII